MIARIPLFIRILIIFLVQGVIVFWMVWDRSQILENGQVVNLQVRPVDPRDIFRGDYVVLDYNISRLRPAELGSREIFSKHDTVYVGLVREESGLWVAQSVSRSLPDGKDGRIFISGRVRRATVIYPNDTAQTRCPDGTCQELYIRYGIESYFVPEGQGRAIEDVRNDMDVVVLAAIAASGRAAIKGLMLDGELRYEEPLF
ncbi:MAG: GDYXXLXY domain-containing protein [Fimbriimonadaceae bacterium]|nr:GDYXXLXY domain-containing protein [Alphaproteobacteria bacterium]